MDKEYIIKKWLQNDLSPSEKVTFDSFDDAELYEEIIQEAQRFKGDTHAKVDSFEVLDKKLDSKKSTSIHWIKIVSSIAAILVVGFALFTLINKDQIISFKTDLAQNENITLPDNSIVSLNELSELEYISTDWNENRSLDLRGEAFFDVEKGKQFEVHTDFGKVTVLGTEFNVLSRDSIFKVSCYEGLVQVTYNNTDVKLPAGTEFTLTSGKGSKSSIVIAEPYWLKNMSVFENATLENVLLEFEKRYSIKVNYQIDKTLNFTGAFEHNNLENALKSITQPLNLTYSIQNNNEVIIRHVQD
ncbi:FecR family protein [Psychroserpens luteolus]|uniref:FecR family protein n=1 Tax=Psychroserpens luteolus TaxID=2855840 RepID=UPI001E3BA828|nr:FecR family protein [Psychroserpens luteolus]MCD2259596.1 FecR family protein [Psychroserpens luteolus]